MWEKPLFRCCLGGAEVEKAAHRSQQILVQSATSFFSLSYFEIPAYPPLWGWWLTATGWWWWWSRSAVYRLNTVVARRVFLLCLFSKWAAAVLRNETALRSVWAQVTAESCWSNLMSGGILEILKFQGVFSDFGVDLSELCDVLGTLVTSVGLKILIRLI